MKTLRLYLMMICLLGLISCSPLSSTTIQKYDLMPDVLVSKARAGNLTMLVNKPIAIPGFRTPKMAYSEQTFAINYYADHEWVGPPAELLLPLMVNTIQNTGRFKAVVPAPFTGITNLRLDSQLLGFYRRFHGKNASRSQFVVMLRASLVERQSERLLASKTFTVIEPISNSTPYAGVQAANLAVTKLLIQLAKFCSSYP